MGRKEGESWQCCSRALLSVCAVMGPSLVGQRLRSQPQQLPWECVWGKDRAEGSDAVRTCWKSPASKPDPTTWLSITSSSALGGALVPEPGVHLSDQQVTLLGQWNQLLLENRAGRKDWAFGRLSFPVKEKELCSQDLLLSVHLCPNYIFLWKKTVSTLFAFVNSQIVLAILKLQFRHILM